MSVSSPATPAANSLEAFRRRARYRAWHRGTKELDLILGAYADANTEDFDAIMLARFEALMENEEVHLTTWLISDDELPQNCDRELIEAIRSFQLERSKMNKS
ncbi:Succinate dehydrogenase flavin-adding protein, antitoxin of CptAB toxin-antitoxin [hydrothermal vent metagenome]|uniref:Succinate dehydrogenase flavin-adding protein, antitoxin of CptAB toxin-antitoxin n=1 Tax=hydrothermal vent metagenome TaxID=652676 RepID=A0A3B0TWY8_9ZZZZ